MIEMLNGIKGKIKKKIKVAAKNGKVYVYDKPEAHATDRFDDNRRAPLGQRKVDKISPITALHDQHHHMARLLVLGYSNVEIAKLLGITPQTVSNIKNSPIVLAATDELAGKADEEAVDIRKEIAEFAPKCVEALKEVIENEDGRTSSKTRADAAIRMLGLAGYVAPKNVNVKAMHGHFDVTQMIRDRAQQIAESDILTDD